MIITLKPQTVITMVGPSHSGKSTQANEIKKYLESIGKTVKILSSDTYRRDFLNLIDNDSIPHAAGFSVSGLAFKKLFEDLNVYTSSPINTDVVIVDTTGLDRKFREEIAEKASAQGYTNIALVFNLSKEQLTKRIEYLDDNQREYKLSYILRQLTRMRERVLSSFNKHNYMSIYRITDKTASVEYEYIDNSKVLNISSGTWATYGDVHQRFEEFQNLLLRLRSEDSSIKHLQVGDWVDKGDETSLLTTINVLYNYVIEKKIPDLELHLLKGNHEEYVYRHLQDPAYVFVECKETEYFTSLRYLTKPENAEYRQRFIELYEASYDYAEMRSDRFWGIVSHSPCEGKYLGKRSPKALKLMRNTRFIKNEDYDSPAIVHMGEIIQERLPIQHIFGHVEVGKNFAKYNNHVAIDSGVCSGGHLTAYIVNLDEGYTRFEYEVSTASTIREILDFSYHIKPWTKVAELTPEQEKRLRRIKKANPAFISSTVSPSPSFMKDDEPFLETVTSAVNLFEKRGVTQLIAQRKHMGSRCQIYLTKDLESSYAISRNGFKIHTNIVGEIIKDLFEKYKDQYKELLILDGELLPWGAIGRGLIDQTFYPYYQAINEELKEIAQSSITSAIPNLEIEQSLEDIEAFKKQVDIYGIELNPYYEPFGVIYCDGEELLTSSLSQTLLRFNIPFESFDITIEEDYDRLVAFYNTQVADGKTEGIVIKPDVWCAGDVPMIKVRNKEYLRLVYGYNYTKYLERHTREKDIRGKLQLSIREQDLNLHLLKAYSENDLGSQEEIYKLLLVEFARETGIDPRL